MTISQAQQAIRETLQAIERVAGKGSYSCYLYGSLTQGFFQPEESNVNLLFILEENIDILELRASFAPVWAEYGHILLRAPLVATQAAWQRYLRLHPALASHIAAYGRQFPPDRKTEKQAVPSRSGVTAAYIAYQGMIASSALAPELLSEDDPRRKEAVPLLRRLVRQRQKRHIYEDELAIELLPQFFGQPAPVSVRGRISSFTSRLTGTLTPMEDGAPFHVPHLIATYERLDDIIFVVDRPTRIGQTNWPMIIAQLRANGYQGLQVVTDQQLLLAVQYHGAMDFTLRSYRHRWGEDILAKLEFPRWRVLRDAARKAADFQIVSLPHALLTTPDTREVNSKLIHDYQNKLLNIRLENELLNRLGLAERVEPDLALPDRHAPNEKRLRAIFYHFNWWAEHYSKLMMRKDE